MSFKVSPLYLSETQEIDSWVVAHMNENGKVDSYVDQHGEKGAVIQVKARKSDRLAARFPNQETAQSFCDQLG